MKKDVRINTKDRLLDELLLLCSVAGTKESVKPCNCRGGRLDHYTLVNKAVFIKERSSTFRKIVGYDEDELKRSTCKSIFSEKKHAVRRNILGKDIFTRCYADVYEKKYRRREDSIIPAGLRIHSIRDINSKHSRIWDFIRDRTECEKAEEALIESERRLKDIIDFLPDATFAINLEGKVIVWNRAVEEMTGVKAENILGKTDYEYALPFYGKRRPVMVDLVLKPDQKIERNYEKITKMQGDLLLAEVSTTVAGRKAFLWGKASPLYDSKGIIVGAIETIRDITDRKQYVDTIKKREIELEAKTHELEDMNIALRVMLRQRESDRKEFEEKILANTKVLILPHIEKLKAQIKSGKIQNHINILESNLKEIVSPFVRTLSVTYSNLTNREIQIANLIKDEKTTKEISQILNISESAVNIHRYRIRQKLNINKQRNLRAFLSGLS